MPANQFNRDVARRIAGHIEKKGWMRSRDMVELLLGDHDAAFHDHLTVGLYRALSLTQVLWALDHVHDFHKAALARERYFKEFRDHGEMPDQTQAQRCVAAGMGAGRAAGIAVDDRFLWEFSGRNRARRGGGAVKAVAENVRSVTGRGRLRGGGDRLSAKDVEATIGEEMRMTDKAMHKPRVLPPDQRRRASKDAPLFAR